MMIHEIANAGTSLLSARDPGFQYRLQEMGEFSGHSFYR
jgi:hypothetical protein